MGVLAPILDARMAGVMAEDDPAPFDARPSNSFLCRPSALERRHPGELVH